MTIPPKYFIEHYQLHGRDWLRRVSAEDRQALAYYAFVRSNYGRDGGRARAETAKRDHRGRFISNQTLSSDSAQA